MMFIDFISCPLKPQSTCMGFFSFGRCFDYWNNVIIQKKNLKKKDLNQEQGWYTSRSSRLVMSSNFQQKYIQFLVKIYNLKLII